MCWWVGGRVSGWGGGRSAGQSEQFPCSPRSPREEVVQGTSKGGLKEKGQEEKHFWTMERIGVCVHVCVCWGVCMPTCACVSVQLQCFHFIPLMVITEWKLIHK